MKEDPKHANALVAKAHQIIQTMQILKLSGESLEHVLQAAEKLYSSQPIRVGDRVKIEKTFDRLNIFHPTILRSGAVGYVQSVMYAQTKDTFLVSFRKDGTDQVLPGIPMPQLRKVK